MILDGVRYIYIYTFAHGQLLRALNPLVETNCRWEISKVHRGISNFETPGRGFKVWGADRNSIRSWATKPISAVWKLPVGLGKHWSAAREHLKMHSCTPIKLSAWETACGCYQRRTRGPIFSLQTLLNIHCHTLIHHPFTFSVEWSTHECIMGYIVRRIESSSHQGLLSRTVLSSSTSLVRILLKWAIACRMCQTDF